MNVYGQININTLIKSSHMRLDSGNANRHNEAVVNGLSAVNEA